MGLEYVVHAPVDRVWKSFISLNPNVRMDPKVIHIDHLRVGDERTDPDQEWSGIQEGIVFEARLLKYVIPQALEVEFTRISPAEHEVEFRYTENAPSRGTQRVVFTERAGADGEPETLIRHEARYEGKNFIFHWLYPSTHHQVWDPFYRHLRREFERGPASDAPPVYETVHDSPQFVADTETFSFYWSLWRSRADIVSEREIRWETRDCASGKVLSADGEKYWFLDRETIPQAPREGFLYLVLGNIVGLHLRGIGPYMKPGDYAEWKARAIPRGAKGEIRFRTEVRTLPESSPAYDEVLKQFSRPSPADFPKVENPKHAPDRWPVYFDERAHKAHSATEPAVWKSLPKDSSSLIPVEAWLEWNACEAGKKIQGVLHIPSKDRLPPGGPDRPGKSADPGSPVKIIYSDSGSD